MENVTGKRQTRKIWSSRRRAEEKGEKNRIRDKGEDREVGQQPVPRVPISPLQAIARGREARTSTQSRVC